jgi:hypothetical protein
VTKVTIGHKNKESIAYHMNFLCIGGPSPFSVKAPDLSTNVARALMPFLVKPLQSHRDFESGALSLQTSCFMAATK